MDVFFIVYKKCGFSDNGIFLKSTNCVVEIMCGVLFLPTWNYNQLA